MTDRLSSNQIAWRAARRRPSDREIQVIDLVRGGATNAEVATTLGLSEKTVEGHLTNVFAKLGVSSRAAVAAAIARNAPTPAP